MKKKLVILLMIVLTFVFLSSVFVKAEEDIIIGKIPITLEAGFHQALTKHEAEYAKEEYNATVKVIDGQFESEVALNAVENFISQGVDGILLHTFDPVILDKCVNAAQDAGIPISTFYNEPETKQSPHVQINEAATSYEIGVMAAEKWQEYHPDTPIKIGLIAYLNVPHARQMRSIPFVEGVKSVAPEAEVVSELDGDGSNEKSFAAGQDMVMAHPEVNIVYGSNADHALPALSAFEMAGRGKAEDGIPQTEIFVGTDATEAELLEVFDPTSALKITQGLQPRTNAEAEIDTMMKIINGEIAADKWVEIPTKNKILNYWDDTIEEANSFLQDQYFKDVNIKEELDL